MTNLITRVLGMPLVATEHGSRIDDFIWYVHWLMAALFVGWSCYFLYVLLRFNNKRNPKADYHGVRNHASSYLEGLVAFFEAVLLLGFAVPIWAKTMDSMPDDPDAIQVQVAGRQFNWTARYAGPDGLLGARNPDLVTVDNPWGVSPDDPNGKDDIIVVNDLIAPVNRTMTAYITSFDVIHAFAVKPFRVTQDAIPGLNIPVSFKPIREGNYMIQCAQLCGNGHYAMRGEFRVVSEEAFDKWMAEQAPAPGSDAGPSADGLSPFE